MDKSLKICIRKFLHLWLKLTKEIFIKIYHYQVWGTIFYPNFLADFFKYIKYLLLSDFQCSKVFSRNEKSQIIVTISLFYDFGVRMLRLSS